MYEQVKRSELLKIASNYCNLDYNAQIWSICMENNHAGL